MGLQGVVTLFVSLGMLRVALQVGTAWNCRADRWFLVWLGARCYEGALG